jgi:hypothetical protein
VLDADGNLFVTDSHHHRIVGLGADGFRCLIVCNNGAGSSTFHLQEPVTAAFDTCGNILLSDRCNKSIQLFHLASNSCGKLTIVAYFRFSLIKLALYVCILNENNTNTALSLR